MPLPTVDVIIVNWNAGRWLSECVRALDTTHPSACVVTRAIVVDNASVDDSCVALAALDIALPLVIERNAVNRGFGAACNQGASGSQADYLLLLNPDAVASTAALDGVIGMLEAHASRAVQIGGVWMEGAEGPQTVWLGAFPTARTFILQALGRVEAWRRSVSLDKPAASADALGAIEVPVVGGAFFAIRRSLFETLNGFDERFFMYFDELDLCLRAHERGARAMLATGVDMYHHTGACTARVPGRRLFYALRSRWLYSWAHFSGLEAAAITLLMCTSEPVLRLGRSIVGRGPDRVVDVLEGYGRFALSLVGISPHERRARAARGATKTPRGTRRDVSTRAS